MDFFNILFGIDDKGAKLGTKEGRFVTIDSRPVFIGGPGQGGGGSASGTTSAQSEQEQKEALIVQLTEGASPEQTARITELLADVPLSDLEGLNAITIASKGFNPTTESLRNTDNQLEARSKSGTWHAITGAYDWNNQELTLDSNTGMNKGTLLHELGHHVTTRNRITGPNASTDPLLIGGSSCVVSLKEFSRSGRTRLLNGMGLRNYSLTNGKEFLADAYSVLRQGTESQRAELNRFWQDHSWSTQSIQELLTQ